jgi:2-dehydro-3-deoxyphosphogalactonate aldolase
VVIREWLSKCSLIAILRGIKPDEVEDVFGGLLAAGVAIAEIPLNSPEAVKSIRRATELYGSKMLIGAGTVTRAAEVEQVRDAGARLVVSPCADAEIVRQAKLHKLISIPGVGTATEAFHMVHACADALKLFPADVLGVRMMTSLRAILPKGTVMIPVGGVDAETLLSWHKAGADGYGIGSSVYQSGATGNEVSAKARQLIEVLNQQ